MSDPQTTDGTEEAGDNPFAAIDLSRTPLGANLFAPNPRDSTLDGGQILYHIALGARPEDFHPALQPLAQGYSLLFRPKRALGPGLLGSRDDIREAIAAVGATPRSAEEADDKGEQDADVSPAVASQRRTLPTIYPKTLDPTVDRHVAEYNAAHGLMPGDREYLDPDLIRAMIRQEAGRDFDTLIRDPMQMNAHTLDWDRRKADLGLAKGVAPGADLSVKAGIQWLRRKPYVHDDHGNESRFVGWPQAVQHYNAHLPDYSDQVWDHLGEIKGGF